MEEVRSKLSDKSRSFLADLYEHPDLIRSLKEALSLRQLELANYGIMTSTKIEDVISTRGKIEEDIWTVKFLKYNHNKTRAEERAKENSEQ